MTTRKNFIIDVLFSSMVALTVAAFIIMKPTVADSSDRESSNSFAFTVYEYSGTMTESDMQARMEYDLMTKEEIQEVMNKE